MGLIQLSILRSDVSCLRNACILKKTYTKIKRRIKKVKKLILFVLKNLYETKRLLFFPKMWVESMARLKVHSHSPRLRVVVN